MTNVSLLQTLVISTYGHTYGRTKVIIMETTAPEKIRSVFSRIRNFSRTFEQGCQVVFKNTFLEMCCFQTMCCGVDCISIISHFTFFLNKNINFQ